jgi:hypothetical protein
VNIDGNCDPTRPTLNCCEPGVAGYVQCVDADATIAAVASLATRKVPTFVVGMPGTSAYRNLLDDVAVAGGTSRPTKPYYFPVEGTDDLTRSLQTIGLQVAIQCEVTLGDAPPDPNLVNVYFDKRVVKRDSMNGWTWAAADAGAGGAPVPSDASRDADGGGTTRIRIVGEACDELRRGDVIELRVVAGCPSVVK